MFMTTLSLFSVNLWYDMDFDIKYNYYKFVEKVAATVKRK